jgi:hypothetical protein
MPISHRTLLTTLSGRVFLERIRDMLLLRACLVTVSIASCHLHSQVFHIGERTGRTDRAQSL